MTSSEKQQDSDTDASKSSDPVYGASEADTSVDGSSVEASSVDVSSGGVSSGGVSSGEDRGEDRGEGRVPSLVRPYTLTAGRTKPQIYLPLEAPVHVAAPPVPSKWPSSDVRTKIVALCAEGPSVAEISARLSLPLGVARVLVGDLVDNGTLRVSATLGDDASADERRELIGRTLRGLRAL